MTTYKVDRLSIDFFMARMDHPVVPIPGLNIPDITIPSHLSGQKTKIESKETVSTYIRHLLNSVTGDNIDVLRKQLFQEIDSKVVSEESLVEIADELLKSFIVGIDNIDNYIKILNTIYKKCIVISYNSETKEKKLSNPIGNIFLDKCRLLIFKNISEAHILELAKKDQYDEDELDEYNKEKDKIINLIIVLCRLYHQKNTLLINIAAVQVYAVMDKMLCFHTKCQNTMHELGDPMEDCKDEEQYEYMRRVCSIYAELLYTFFHHSGNQFNTDTTNVKGNTLQDITQRFRKEVVPSLTEAHMRVKCNNL